jgi:hypothetical protein
MSKKKITKVLDFLNHKQQANETIHWSSRLFSRLCGHHSMIMKPLHDMIKNYQKKTRGKPYYMVNGGKPLFSGL